MFIFSSEIFGSDRREKFNNAICVYNGELSHTIFLTILLKVTLQILPLEVNLCFLNHEMILYYLEKKSDHTELLVTFTFVFYS